MVVVILGRLMFWFVVVGLGFLGRGVVAVDSDAVCLWCLLIGLVCWVLRVVVCFMLLELGLVGWVCCLLGLWAAVVWVFDCWVLLRLVVVCVDLVSVAVNSVGIIRNTFYFELYFGLLLP